MLTLPPKRRGREQAACWQLLRFAAGLTRPDGTSARVPWQPSPVETTHPHRTEPPFGERMVALAFSGANSATAVGAAADRLGRRAGRSGRPAVERCGAARFRPRGDRSDAATGPGRHDSAAGRPSRDGTASFSRCATGARRERARAGPGPTSPRGPRSGPGTAPPRSPCPAGRTGTDGPR